MGFGDAETPTLVYDFGDDRRTVISFFGSGVGFNTALHYRDGRSKELRIESDFFRLFIADMVRFFRTGEPSFDIKETLTVVAMLEAGRKAASNPGVWVDVKDT